MLAQNFKTATDIGMSDRELEAHIKVLGMLERGEFHHVISSGQNEFGFNMGTTGTWANCGTVACIGGWAAFFMGHNEHKAMDYVGRSSGERQELYYPHWSRPINPGRITVEQAATALRSYLTTGEAHWDEALAS